MKILSVLLFLLCFLQCRGKRCSRSIKPLGITVLYESLCTDSQRFIRKFWPVFKDYHSCINLTLVPYGKATTTRKSFECQHGQQECWGNRMQDCALHSNLNQLQKMQFVACQMKDLRLVVKKDFKCAKYLNIFNNVRNCMKSNGNGIKYQVEAARITSRYDFSEIPAIIYNGLLDDGLQQAFRTNVRQTVCEIMVETKHLLPDDC